MFLYIGSSFSPNLLKWLFNAACEIPISSRVYLLKSTTTAAVGRRLRGEVTPCGMRQDGIVNFQIFFLFLNTGQHNTLSLQHKMLIHKELWHDTLI